MYLINNLTITFFSNYLFQETLAVKILGWEVSENKKKQKKIISSPLTYSKSFMVNAFSFQEWKNFDNQVQFWDYCNQHSCRSRHLFEIIPTYILKL
jgi:hypothetical protein